MNNRGIRSGRERSSPTWGHGCRGVSGRRKSVDLVRGYEGPPLVLPLQFTCFVAAAGMHLDTAVENLQLALVLR